jgi:hypothetical protein
MFRFGLYQCQWGSISYIGCYNEGIHTIRACEQSQAILEVQQKRCGDSPDEPTFPIVTIEPSTMWGSIRFTTLEEALVGIYDEDGPNRTEAGQKVEYACGSEKLGPPMK